MLQVFKNISHNLTAKLLGFARILPFRKRGLGYVSVAVILFLLLLTGYILSGVFRGLEVPIQTVTAVEYESSVGYYSAGYVVRKETVLTSNLSITSLALSEGQKAATGQTVAMGYTSVDAQQCQQQISDLADELTQLQYAASTSAAVYDQAAMDAQIRDKLIQVAVLLGKGRISAVQDSAPELKGLILRRSSDEGDLSAIQAQIRETEDQITALRSQTSGSISPIPAPLAGYFSGTTDGYEAILTPEAITSMSVSDTENIKAETPPAGAVGKIISGDTWYFMTVIPTEYLSNVKVDQTATVSFAQELTAGSIPMKIHHISPEEDGKAVIILSSSHYLQDMTLMRQQHADIIFDAQSGLRIPKEAVHVTEDGKVGVYILESTRADWKPVTILTDNGETYLVALDKSSTDHLWPGDEVIVSGVDDLYDEKVVF